MQMDHVDGTAQAHACCIHEEQKQPFTPKSFIYIKYSLMPKGIQLFPDSSFLFLF